MSADRWGVDCALSDATTPIIRSKFVGDEFRNDSCKVDSLVNLLVRSSLRHLSCSSQSFHFFGTLCVNSRFLSTGLVCTHPSGAWLSGRLLIGADPVVLDCAISARGGIGRCRWPALLVGALCVMNLLAMTSQVRQRPQARAGRRSSVGRG